MANTLPCFDGFFLYESLIWGVSISQYHSASFFSSFRVFCNHRHGANKSSSSATLRWTKLDSLIAALRKNRPRKTSRNFQGAWSQNISALSRKPFIRCSIYSLGEKEMFHRWKQRAAQGLSPARRLHGITASVSNRAPVTFLEECKCKKKKKLKWAWTQVKFDKDNPCPWEKKSGIN